MYKFVEDLTSDVMFIAEATNITKLLEECGKAIFDVVCQRELVKPKEFIEIHVKGENPEELLYEWLSALLTESDANELFFSKFEIEVEEKNGVLFLKGKALGEPYTPEKSGTVVKGVTYYNFKVEKNENGYRASVVCDI